MQHSVLLIGSERTRRHWRRVLSTFGAALALTVGSAGPAAADEVTPTAQAVAANATWLAYAPPPSHPVSVCLVDTGVDINADTQDALLTRVALDGGTPDDVDPTVRHGTRMAMIMAAARNGTGMVGVWPALRIVSVRAAGVPAPGQPASFVFTAYDRAITECLALDRDDAPVKVVELALGGARSPTEQEASALEARVSQAHAAGVNVVAAAGNDGSAVNSPAVLPGVVGVGAADARGVFCDFSSRGYGLDLLAPGCGLDTANPLTLRSEVGSGGTSQSSAFAATVIAAIRAYRPDLSWHDAENLVLEARSDGTLDVAAVFRAAGLIGVVETGIAATNVSGGPPAAPAEQGPLETAPTVNARAPLPRPRLHRATWRRGVLTVALTTRPKGTATRLVVYSNSRGRLRRVKGLTRSVNAFRLKLPKRPTRIVTSFVDISGALRAESPKLTIERFGR